MLRKGTRAYRVDVDIELYCFGRPFVSYDTVEGNRSHSPLKENLLLKMRRASSPRQTRSQELKVVRHRSS